MSSFKVAIIVFPASNCDRDVAVCLEKISHVKPYMVWHGDTQLPKSDIIILPGGFSYGDYLRCGSMAAKSLIMRDVVDHAQKGTPILGICNGFQILTECNLLPGVLLHNQNLRFVCRSTHLIVGQCAKPFMSQYKTNQKISMPVAHHQGNYFADEDTLKLLQNENRIALRYAKNENPNGSCLDIAAIVNETHNVLGMMPHPERCADSQLGGTDGKKIFESLVESLT